MVCINHITLPKSRGIHSCLSVCRRSTEQTAEPRVTKFVTGIHTFGGWELPECRGIHSCLSVDDLQNRLLNLELPNLSHAYKHLEGGNYQNLVESIPACLARLHVCRRSTEQTAEPRVTKFVTAYKYIWR
ncbi:hypothetical protein AVEN_25705-1 [Araneus ventricosus]|uniref:Uncharacterized protein n=1 Tax=Araneus ventricosus TaxID=182803 RepID=A0A4Y2TWW7_ARAVE|nr:hypothetical protein AVEN_25705-1 [Araneus ventricosus]